jgi:hypothetical protein
MSRCLPSTIIDDSATARELVGWGAKRSKMTLRDAQGKQVYMIAEMDFDPSGVLHIETINLKAGLYFLEIVYESTAWCKKPIIE